MNVVGECSFRHVAANDDSSTAANSSSDMDLDDTPQPICSSSESAEVIFNNVPSVFSKKGRRPPHRSDIMQTTRSAELVNDILTASVPSRRESPLWKNKNPLEYPAPPLAPIRAPSLPRINLDNDDDDDASIIPPCWKPIMEGHNSSCSFQSSFSSVFDASQAYDFPLARPIRTLSPLVSLAGSYCNASGNMAPPAALVSPSGSIAGFCSFRKLSDSMEEL